MSSAELWVARGTSLGEPLALHEFRKAPVPVTGDRYGAWNEDIVSHRMPGGSVLTFDLSRLTLDDYRQMRTDYQINASLLILLGMVAQCDFSIYTKGEETDPKAKQISDTLEEGIRRYWMSLVRALFPAFWAGFAPTVTCYDLNASSKYYEITKYKDLIPDDARVDWELTRYPDGTGVYTYSGIINRGRKIPGENCVHPDTEVLCADLIWRRAGDLQVGQEIVAFDEDDTHLPGGLGGRRYRTAKIVVNIPGTKPSCEIRTDLGPAIIASSDHPFLVRVLGEHPGSTRDPHTGRFLGSAQNTADHWEWRDADQLKQGDKVAWFGFPWHLDESRGAGWLAGIFDGEGSFSNGTLSVAQNEGAVLDQIKSALAERGYSFSASPNQRDNCVQLVVHGGCREVMRFLAEMQPERFMRHVSVCWDGVWIKVNKSVDLASVESVTHLGVQPIASIQTSSGTFITNGYLTHNTLWYPMLMENGNYYGTKLLKPAFAPWFFSQLIHLYTNRFFERFGEPTAVGYYPSDETVKDANGNTVSAREQMQTVIQNLRSRGVVTVPSDRDPDNGELEWEIKYLEAQMRGADFDRYLARLDEEKSMALFTPVLLFRAGERGSFGLADIQAKVFMWMLNMILGDMKSYLDPYVIKPLHDINFGPNAPQSEIRFRTLGRLADAGAIQIAQALIQNGGAKLTAVGVRDLGDYIGVDMEYLSGAAMPGGGQPGAVDPNAPGQPGRGASEHLVTDSPIGRTIDVLLSPGSGAQALMARDAAKEQLHFAKERLEDQVINIFRRKDGTEREVALSRVKLGFKGAFMNEIQRAGGNLTEAEFFFHNLEGVIRASVTEAHTESDAIASIRNAYADNGMR